MDKTALTEDRICTVLKEKLYSMADCESQMEYEPLQLKWMLPLEGTQGMITIFKNVVFLLGYVQKHGCSKDTVDQIIENDIQPVVSGLSNEYDFFISSAIIIICNTVDDFSNERELMSLVHEIIGKFIYILELAAKQPDSVGNDTSKNGILYEIDTSKLVIGMVVKNYKELCNLFGEETKTGKAKQLQLKNWQRYFDWEKDGQKFIITDIYDTPLPKEDLRRKGNNSIYKNYIELILLQYLSKQEGYKKTFILENDKVCQTLC